MQTNRIKYRMPFMKEWDRSGNKGQDNDWLAQGILKAKQKDILEATKKAEDERKESISEERGGESIDLYLESIRDKLNFLEPEKLLNDINVSEWRGAGKLINFGNHRYDNGVPGPSGYRQYTSGGQRRNISYAGYSLFYPYSTITTEAVFEPYKDQSENLPPLYRIEKLKKEFDAIAIGITASGSIFINDLRSSPYSADKDIIYMVNTSETITSIRDTEEDALQKVKERLSTICYIRQKESRVPPNKGIPIATRAEILRVQRLPRKIF